MTQKESLTFYKKPNHMAHPWKDAVNTSNSPISTASLVEKTTFISRVGLLLLGSGTGAWRIRSSINHLASELDLIAHVDVGLLHLALTCLDGEESLTQSFTLANTGVNTSKIFSIETFIDRFASEGKDKSFNELQEELDLIDHQKGHYSPWQLGLASAFACSAFTFLLGGGLIEMLFAFLGAGIGNYTRVKMLQRKWTLFLSTAASVSIACLVYALALKGSEGLFNVSLQHQAGYLCSMLFIIPGFPFITSGIDLSKLDIRSGIERGTYALLIILVATLSAWLMATALGLKPVNFVPLSLSPFSILILRLIASFVGVFGFSMSFNSSVKMATSAALIGAIANTTRLELIDLVSMSSAEAAFIGALISGLLASASRSSIRFPRISLTVPSIVIMVPGLYLYRGVYLLGMMQLTSALTWLASATLIILFLPLGLIFARILTDASFRHAT